MSQERTREPSQTSGLAIASFVLGILFFVPPAPIVGLVLGIIALVKIDSSRGALTGKGLAIVGIVFGAVFTLLMCLLAPVAAMLLPGLTRARNHALAAASRNNLKQIGLAVLMYEADYDAMPENLQVLCDHQYIWRVSVLARRRSHSQIDPNQVDFTADYLYFPVRTGPEKGISQALPGVPIAWERQAGWYPAGRVGVVYADGHVEVIEVSELEELLSRYGDLYLVPPKLPTYGDPHLVPPKLPAAGGWD